MPRQPVQKRLSTLLPFGAFTALLLAGAVGPVRALVQHAQANPTASHILLVPFVTLVLIWQERDAIFRDMRRAPFAGSVIVLAGLALLVAGHLGGETSPAGNALSLAIAGLVVAWLGGFVAFYGGAAARAARFPLLFLFFAVPFPEILLDVVTRVLKTGSSEVVAGLFTLSGTPFHRDGFVFAIPNLAIEVADECSGIRSSIGLALTSLLAGRLFLANRWARVLLVAAVVPITILKNGIRIVSLCLLSIHVDPAFITGQLHRDGGVLFFLLGLAMLVPVLALLRRVQEPHAPRTIAA